MKTTRVKFVSVYRSHKTNGKIQQNMCPYYTRVHSICFSNHFVSHFIAHWRNYCHCRVESRCSRLGFTCCSYFCVYFGQTVASVNIFKNFMLWPINYAFSACVVLEHKSTKSAFEKLVRLSGMHGNRLIFVLANDAASHIRSS